MTGIPDNFDEQTAERLDEIELIELAMEEIKGKPLFKYFEITPNFDARVMYETTLMLINSFTLNRYFHHHERYDDPFMTKLQQLQLHTERIFGSGHKGL